MLTRRHFLTGLLASAPVLAAPAVLRANFSPDEARVVSLFSRPTGERFAGIYFEHGEYLPDAMAEIDRLMRDFHANEVMVMDVRLIDLLARMSTRLEVGEIAITSGYRSMATNRMLRERMRRAATNSMHMYGMAADLRIGGRGANALAQVARLAGAGGVGTYRGSDFIHVDVGERRDWRR